jgi:hypothetical protein
MREKMSRFRTRSLFNPPNRRPALAVLFLLLLAFVLFVLPEWITLNRLIPSLSERFREATGRTLSVDQIRLSFWTGPQLRFHHVVIGGREGSRPLAEAREIRIGFQLLPLLWKRVEIVEIDLIEPTLALARDHKGDWNFEDLLHDREKEAGKGWRVAIRSGVFTLRQGRFSLIDYASTGYSLEWTAQRVETRIGRLFRSRETRLEGEALQIAVTLSKDLPPVTIEQARWNYEGREGRFTLRNTQFSNSTLTETTGVFHPFTEERLEMKTAGQVSLADAAEVADKCFGNQRLKRLKTDGLVEATLTMKIPLEAPFETEFHGRLSVREGTLTPFFAFRPIQKIKGTVQVEGKELLIESAEGEWGGGRLAATGKMPNLYAEGIEFDLHAATLDWDAIRLPPDKAKPSRPHEDRPKGPTSKPPEPDEGRPQEKGYAVGLIRIDHLKIKDYDFFNWHSAVIYREKTLQFRETEANFEEGIFRAKFAQATFRPDGSVALALTPHLEQISVAAFLADFRGDGERPLMSGRGLVVGGLNTEGKNLREFKKNLSGNLVVYLEGGKIYRFRALARIFALMTLRAIPDLDVKGIEYDALSGTLSLARGIVALHDTVLFGRDVRVIANGTIDVAKNELDLLMGVQVFRLVDEILKQLPVAGPILLGKDQMFVASYFEVKGKPTDPRVRFKPFKTIKESTLAVLRRALPFPARPEEFSG